MDRADRIRAGIKALSRQAAPSQMQLGTVEAVDEQAQTCDVQIDEGYIIYDVRLTSVDEAEIVMIPKVGAWCVVAIIDNEESLTYAMGFSAIDKILANVEEVVINDGENGGLVNVSALIDEIDALKRDLNNLKTAFKSWVVTPNDGGAKLKTAASVWASSSLELTNRDALEDTKVKH